MTTEIKSRIDSTHPEIKSIIDSAHPTARTHLEAFVRDSSNWPLVDLIRYMTSIAGSYPRKDVVAAYCPERTGLTQNWDSRYEASAGRDTRTDRQVARDRMVARHAAMDDAERAELAAMAAD